MTQSTLKKITGLYLALAGVIFLGFYYYSLGLVGLISTLLPSIIATMVYAFYIITGWRCCFHERSLLNDRLLMFALVFQSIQLSAFGFIFANFYGPVWCFGIDSHSSSLITSWFRPFAVGYSNGFRGSADEQVLLLNILPVIALIALGVWKK
ncbi:MAG: hypothetical protein EOO05_02520 [Chitinophagaceae bacterium]|nr:MAG: hypothetical protein EOO05_02520 [Chitinophagaceae bacterium]